MNPMGISIGIGIGIGQGKGGGGGPAPSISISLGARFVGLGDSITSQSSTKGVRNWLAWTAFLLNGRLRPTVAADQGKGGNTMTQILARIGNTTGQKPDVVFGMWGHNDAFTAGTTATLITRNRLILDGLRSALPDATIVWHAALPSNVGTESPTVLADFNSDGEDWCIDDGNAIYIPVPTGYDPALHTEDGVHNNAAGALLCARNAVTVLDPFIEAATRADVLDQVTAVGEVGANLDTEHALAGTTGTKTGTITPTGTVATGKEVANNRTNGTSVSCTVAASGGVQTIDAGGTGAAAATVVFDEAASSNVTLSAGGDVGKFYEYLIGLDLSDTDDVSAPTGLRDIKSSIGSLGNFMSISASGSTVDLAEAVSGVVRTWPLVLTTNGTVTVSPDMTLSFSTNAADTRAKLQKPIVRQVETVAYALPFYCGNDTVISATGTVRITGTATNGSVLTGAPGTWSGGAVAITFQWKRYNAGTNVFDSDIAGATSLSYTLTGGEVGFKIGLTVTATNSFGAVTQDSALTATVT